MEQQIQVLGEKEPEGANITRIGHLRAVVDKVKASRAFKLTEVPTAQGPKVPVTQKKGGLDMYFEEQKRLAKLAEAPWEEASPPVSWTTPERNSTGKNCNTKQLHKNCCNN